MVSWLLREAEQRCFAVISVERGKRGGMTYLSFWNSDVLDVRCDQSSSNCAVQSGGVVLLCEVISVLSVGGVVVQLTEAFRTKMSLSWDAIG